VSAPRLLLLAAACFALGAVAADLAVKAGWRLDRRPKPAVAAILSGEDQADDDLAADDDKPGSR
jgi:hypothetical protein